VGLLGSLVTEHSMTFVERQGNRNFNDSLRVTTYLRSNFPSGEIYHHGGTTTKCNHARIIARAVENRCCVRLANHLVTRRYAVVLFRARQLARCRHNCFVQCVGGCFYAGAPWKRGGSRNVFPQSSRIERLMAVGGN
jgi:hypothetical protein